MQVVDQAGRQELADHRRAATDADVLAVRRLPGPLEGLRRRCVDEVEGRAAVHLDRWARVMGEHEYRRMEWRVGPPPPRPFGNPGPPRQAELSGAPALGADPVSELPPDGARGPPPPPRPARRPVPPP